jgi:hypothetical protein
VLGRQSQLKRTGFKRKTIERKPVVLTPVPEHLRRKVRTGPAELQAAPKTEQHRNQRLLDMAKGKPCQMAVPGVCSHDPATVVAAHSNSSKHGKAGARKADDHYVVYACFSCHTWYDQGGGARDREMGQKAWDAAHIRQIGLWHEIAMDPAAKEADRRAARWALDLISQQTP